MKRMTTDLQILLALLTLTPLAARAGEEKKTETTERGQNEIQFKKSKGLFLPALTKETIGLKMLDVEEKALASTLTLQAQVYDTATAGTALASAWLPLADAEKLSPGQTLQMEGNRPATVQEISLLTAKVNQQAEVLLAITDKDGKLAVGNFVAGSLALPGAEGVVIPRGALLTSCQGTFVYTDNGGWLMRTAVTAGAEKDGLIAISDGLLSGDQIVANPVMTLWMTELQAVNGGKA